MNRRRLLRLGGSFGVLALAGCGGRSEEEFKLSITNHDLDSNSEGYIVTNVTISNPGNTRQNGTLYVTSTFDDRELVRVREVSIGAHETTQVSITYDVKAENVSSTSIQPDLRPSE